MQTRALGGTVGLAQCGSVLNSKVSSIIVSAVTSGRLSPADAATLAQGVSEKGAGVSSIQNVAALSPALQSLVRDAFQQGSRWAFISLIPWAGVSFLLTLWLSSIRDTDRIAREAQAQGVKTTEAKGTVNSDEEKPEGTR